LVLIAAYAIADQLNAEMVLRGAFIAGSAMDPTSPTAQTWIGRFNTRVKGHAMTAHEAFEKAREELKKA
jgi:hypothetical protein